MTEQEALKTVSELIHKVSGKTMEIRLEQDLRADNLLDSLDILVFFMEFEKETGISVPETAALVQQEEWYTVRKLCQELASRA